MGLGTTLFNDALDVTVTPYTKGALHETIDDPTFREEFIKDPLFGGDDYWRIATGSRSRAYNALS